MASNTSAEYQFKRIPKQAFCIKTSRQDGLLLQIHHTVPDCNKKAKTLKFVLVAFDDTGEQLAAADQSGNIFIIDFSCFRFWMLPMSGKCSVLAYSTYRKNEIMLGKLNGTIYFAHTEFGNPTGFLAGHNEPVSQITFATGQPCCLTVSTTEAIIWDLCSNSKLHRLTLHSNVKHKQVLFVPVSNRIFASFEDNTIHLWTFETFECVRYSLPSKWGEHRVTSTAFTRDGLTMAVGSNTSSVIVISLDTWKLKRMLQLPKYVAGVKHLEFVSRPFDGGSCKVLAVLSNKGSALLFNVETAQLLTFIELPRNKVVNELSCCTNGKYLVTLLNSGELNIYSSSKLLAIPLPVTGFDLDADKHTISAKNGSHLKKVQLKKKKVKSKLQTTRLNNLHSRIDTILEVGRLKPMLKEFGEYPANYRLLIWKSILQLPENRLAYNALVSKGWHPVCETVDSAFPLKNSYFSNYLKRTISCLSHWSPLFSQLRYLPNVIFPFVKAFSSDQFACFEVAATFIVNWCQRWFEFFPFPPINVLSMIENILTEWDQELFMWLTENQITPHQYGWTLLQTVFSVVLGGKEWLQLFDHILSNDPPFMVFAVAGYNMMCRSTLLNITEQKDFDYFFHNQTAIDMKQFIKKIYFIYNGTADDECHPRNYLKPFTPLASGDTYQIYNEYPKFVVDKQAEQVNSMRKELTDLLKEQSRLACAQADQEKKHAIELNKQVQKQQMMALQKQYENALKEEEERIAVHHKKVSMMKRDLRRREMLQTKETRDRIQQQVTQQRTAALEALLSELDHKREDEGRRLKELEEETIERHRQLAIQKELLNEQLELLGQAPVPAPLAHVELQAQQTKLAEELIKLREKGSLNWQSRNLEMSSQLAAADDFLQKAEFDLAYEMAERQKSLFTGQHNIQTIELEVETKELQQEVDKMLQSLVEKRIQESCDLMRATKESRIGRKAVQDDLHELIMKAGKETTSGESSDLDLGKATTSTNRKHYAANPPACHPCSGRNDNENGLYEDLSSRINKTKTVHQLTSLKTGETTNDNVRFGRGADFYKREQDAIKSSMDIRKQLLLNRRRKSSTCSN